MLKVCNLPCLFLIGMLLLSGCGAAPQTIPTIKPTESPEPPPSPTPVPQAVQDAFVVANMLSGDPCEPPCWQEITPGVSSREDVADIARQLEEQGVLQLAPGSTAFFCDAVLLMPDAEIGSGQLGHVEIGFDRDGYVSFLYAYYHERSLLYDAEQVIERYGEPEAIFAFDLQGSSCSCEEWDDSYYDHARLGAYLLYPSRGMTLVVEMPRAYRGCICPRFLVVDIYLYPPTSLVEAQQEEYTPVCAMNPCLPDHILAWHGFGAGYLIPEAGAGP